MYAFVGHRDFLFVKGGSSMDLQWSSLASEFKDFQLKVVSLAPIKVTVIGHDDEVLEEFQTSANHSM